ncbi:MAG: electron transport complex subunit E [Candidatus Thiodiazotropha sp. (ex. Lucinisca nassula)]|nr:electron transport complex subunit E [Candidatus Thiodiazotropha sp. (ex. Lucinisca nassula)]MBW9272283.1 electron transport complex subunit E [Candidatus Thiodiazotropha sp. (ex. Lucinisca nassula)]PUB85216.1 MAG: electron transport complex subunit RsxE [gamma proteobacterium symbiont of Ctena orbiculata]PUB87093.1 MAG: electron transport complex subunit RsxE [gamma proteobacterium symbiont of Ctena orbiculata]
MSSDYGRIAKDGIWDNNIVFAQALGLCPLLAVTGTASNGLGMGLASTVVMIASGLLISLFRGIITPQVRIPVFVLIIAVLVTLVDMFMNAWMHDLHKVLGLFIPLIVTNCAILGRAESFASRNSILPSLFDGLMMGAGFTMVLVILGAAREVLGSGTLFANAVLLLGHWASFMELTLIPDYKGFLLIILPPGGFVVLGFLLAGKRLVDRILNYRQKRVTTPKDSATATPT